MSKKELPLTAIHELFTETEIEVIKLICQEFTHIEMAAKLKINARTLEKRRASIMRKTKARNVVGIVKYAIKNKIFILK
jgi:DNA-binding NarL/FixJ family response regulator